MYMKKKNIYTLCTLILTSGCQHVTEEPLPDSPIADINFRVVHVEKQPISRSELAESCSSLNYYRYTDGILSKDIEQSSTSDDFGSISDEIKFGSHELYFIGHKTKITSFTYGIASFSKISDTFSYYVNLTVDDKTESVQTIELPRRVAKFELIANDALPEVLSTVDFNITGAATSLNTKTGKGLTMATQTKTIQVPNSNLNVPGCTFSAYVFLLDKTGEVSITVTCKDESGNILANHSFSDVEMETNYVTRYKGNLFGDGVVLDVTALPEWTGSKEYTF